MKSQTERLMKSDKRVYLVSEIAEKLNITRNATYILCHSKEFRIVKVGSGIRIAKHSFDCWFKEKGADKYGR